MRNRNVLAFWIALICLQPIFAQDLPPSSLPTFPQPAPSAVPVSPSVISNFVSGETSTNPYRVWVAADYMLLWARAVPGSSPSVIFANPGAAHSSVHVPAGGSNFNFGPGSGASFSFGVPLSPGGTWGVSAGALFLEHKSGH